MPLLKNSPAPALLGWGDWDQEVVWKNEEPPVPETISLERTIENFTKWNKELISGEVSIVFQITI